MISTEQLNEGEANVQPRDRLTTLRLRRPRYRCWHEVVSILTLLWPCHANRENVIYVSKVWVWVLFCCWCDTFSLVDAAAMLDMQTHKLSLLLLVYCVYSRLWWCHLISSLISNSISVTVPQCMIWIDHILFIHNSYGFNVVCSFWDAEEEEE